MLKPYPENMTISGGVCTGIPDYISEKEAIQQSTAV